MFDMLPGHPSQSQLLALASVRSLTLGSRHFNWASAVYHNLVDLNVDGLLREVCLTTEQMTLVLCSSLRLRRLRLRRLGIVQHEPHTLPNPIVLSELHELNLRSLYEGLCCIPPLMAVRPRLTSASIQFHSVEDEVPVRSCFRQSSVVTLHVKDLCREQPTQALQLLEHFLASDTLT